MTTPDNRTALGDRMKRYERAFKQTLPRRAYTLMRLDGRAFHTYLKDSEKPFDNGFVEDMDAVATVLCKEIQGVQFAYTQSDEISLLITDFQTLQSDPPFGGVVAKLLSIPPSIASVVMHSRRQSRLLPQFDCRVWSMTDPVEVANYFVWRQRDAVTNSIQMLAQHYYRPRSLHGRSTNELQGILFREQGVNWNDLDGGLKRGRVVYPKYRTAEALAASGDDKQMSAAWLVSPASNFVAAPDNWLAAVIPPLPSLHGTELPQGGER
jgi:tRNA(His) 5'-end guanylyltransferase